LIKKIKSIGPGIIITSAFIGPGTITICSLAGNKFEYSLLWAILFSVLATSYLQEMSCRLGLITKNGLSEIIRKHSQSKVLMYIFSTLIFFSIFVGNVAYEAGNISGTSMGIESIINSRLINISGISLNIVPFFIGLILIYLIIKGNYKIIEKLMIGLVFIMSITFLITAIISGPDLKLIFKGLLIPSINNNNILVVIGIIGTTVVPYNLFLHSYIVNERWGGKKDLKNATFDTIISVIIGGIISMSIIITSGSSKIIGNNIEINNAMDLGTQLQPFLGLYSKYLISIGLFAAGISSSLTAPLATSYALSGIFNYEANLSNKYFKFVAIVIILTGLLFSSLNYKPIMIIKFAQIINGIFLPFIAIFLFWAINRPNILGSYVNSRSYNFLGIFIIGITIILGVKSIISVI